MGRTSSGIAYATALFRGSVFSSVVMLVACDGTPMGTGDVEIGGMGVPLGAAGGEPSAGDPMAQGGQVDPSATGGTMAAMDDGVLAKLDPRLQAALAADQSQDVIVLLDQGPVAGSASDQAPDIAASAAHLRLAKESMLGRLRMQQLSMVDSFQNLPAVHMQAQSSAALKALAADPAVVRVVPNEALAMLDTGPQI